MNTEQDNKRRRWDKGNSWIPAVVMLVAMPQFWVHWRYYLVAAIVFWIALLGVAAFQLTLVYLLRRQGRRPYYRALAWRLSWCFVAAGQTIVAMAPWTTNSIQYHAWLPLEIIALGLMFLAGTWTFWFPNRRYLA
ncbi:MAG TPA: hypothetical protein VFA78_08220 [Chloroflexota bacterium]|nr:hypothetical protein [Chloroflexota bacterium]